MTAEGVLSEAEREVTPRSILSWCLVGARPYDEAQRILDKLEGAGWTVTRLAARAAAADEEARGRLEAALEQQLEWAAAVAASPTGWTAPEVVRHLSGRIRAVLETLDAPTATQPEFVHIADRKAGDLTPLCVHEYAGHDGPCVGGEPFPGAAQPEQGGAS